MLLLWPSLFRGSPYTTFFCTVYNLHVYSVLLHRIFYMVSYPLLLVPPCRFTFRTYPYFFIAGVPHISTSFTFQLFGYFYFHNLSIPYKFTYVKHSHLRLLFIGQVKQDFEDCLLRGSVHNFVCVFESIPTED